ncbi:hypothetical protein Ppa06_58360 [Planomonospora parontospora subsp. parontospora]|uniref:Uncharacterized protein n=2 Tax=Planomonospora parontospora TaxID=58119 RepID=A0AA37BLX3_9ACTN|nr:hypothetical protein [Planomonospora parontospora]GGK90092.1 hypothetical protein GCM10010126_56950 [Planomonospora parontospora]GII12038.1 hypothetical protein Ppa06_58360 [Planomonospora parontospora subsp. parontospora]
MAEQQPLNVSYEQIIEGLRRRIGDLTYENVLLGTAVDQLQERITELTGDDRMNNCH